MLACHDVQPRAYTCFLEADAKLPMMYMPDCLEATWKLMMAPPEQLTRATTNGCISAQWGAKRAHLDDMNGLQMCPSCANVHTSSTSQQNCMKHSSDLHVCTPAHQHPSTQASSTHHRLICMVSAVPAAQARSVDRKSTSSLPASQTWETDQNPLIPAAPTYCTPTFFLQRDSDDVQPRRTGRGDHSCGAGLLCDLYTGLQVSKHCASFAHSTCGVATCGRPERQPQHAGIEKVRLLSCWTFAGI
eukprot:357381-Chlamydomonas_euryale.AAC.17